MNNVTLLQAEVEETPENVAGWFNQTYIIGGILEDPVRRLYCAYELYSLDNPSEISFAYIAARRHSKNKSEKAIHITAQILSALNGRTKHVPRLRAYGVIKRLHYAQEGEYKPETARWNRRPYVIVSHENICCAALISFSPKQFLPTLLVLHLALGMAESLIVLHKAGYVHRQVSLYTFCYPVPLTLENISSRLIIQDFSLCTKFLKEPTSVEPFVGCTRYATLRAHNCRPLGPADDFISMLYVVAEMISGKLPWRAVRSRDAVATWKQNFTKSKEYMRLPRELRLLSAKLCTYTASAFVQEEEILCPIREAIKRLDPNGSYELPKWLVMPPPN